MIWWMLSIAMADETFTRPQPTDTNYDLELAYHEAIYHLNCVTSTQEERQVKALLHDVMRPEVRIAGQHPSHAIYEPERYATRPPATVPPEDADALRTVVSGRQRA